MFIFASASLIFAMYFIVFLLSCASTGPVCSYNKSRMIWTCSSAYSWSGRQSLLSSFDLWIFWLVRRELVMRVLSYSYKIISFFIESQNIFQFPAMKSHSPSKGSLLENSKYQATVETTIAEFNKVSLKPAKNTFCAESPFRIRLPEYFNIPTFQDCNIFSGASTKQNKLGLVAGKEDIVFKKRMKDLGILVEGMKRAKNIKQESRYYFTQGVLLHNAGQYLKSIELFEKFLKIVIYLQDTKSVELCLNVIGCAYMYLRNYDKAIQFHKKQGNVSDTSDKYYSLVNIGLCAELAGATKEAYNKYNQALQTIESEQPESKRERAQALETLLQRVSAKMNADEVFVTENLASKSPSKAIHSSFIKEESSLLMKKVASRKEYQQAKLSFAISSAEQNIQEHLKSSANYTLFN